MSAGRWYLMALLVLGTALPPGTASADDPLFPPFETGPNWVSLGPSPVVSGASLKSENILSPPMSGRATVLAVNPKNRYNVWLGTAGGGLWVTNNVEIGGLQASQVKPDPPPPDGKFDRSWRPEWHPHNDGFTSLSIGAVVLDESSCDANGCSRVWVGTGENSLRRDTWYGDGLYEVGLTVNEVGASWHWKRLDAAKQFRYGTTAALVADGGELFIALSAGNTTTSVYANVRAPEPAAGYGVHRRAADGTWTQVFDTPSNGKEAWADQLLPTDLVKGRASANEFYLGVLNDGIFRTTDRGATWCAMNPGSRLQTASANGQIPTPISDCSAGTGLPQAGTFDHVELAVESAKVLYALFGNCPSGFTAHHQGATSSCELDPDHDSSPFLYKSTDGGATWSQPGTLTGAHHSRYTHALVTIGAEQLLWGSLEPWHLKTASGLEQIGFRSNSLHFDVHDLTLWGSWDDGQPVVYGATDGGFYIWTRGAWAPANDSLITTAFCNIALDNEDEPDDGFPRTTAILGGLQDNSNAAYNGSPKWQLWGPIGDGGETLIQTPTITFDSVQATYDEIPPARSIRRIPGFIGFKTHVDGPLANAPEDVGFYLVLTQHEETKRIFVGTDVISVREGTPEAWNGAGGAPFPDAVQISPVLGTDGHAFPPIETDRDLITAVAVAPSHGWRVYAGLYSGKLWRSTTSESQRPTPTPADWIRADNGLPAGTIASIAVHPKEHKKLWVAFSDFLDQTVWYSEDEGASWNPRSTGLPPREPVKVIKVVPDEPAKLWLGTDTGVYLSTNGGVNWERRTANLPIVPVFDIEIDRHTDRVFAATHGRGVWMLTDKGPVLTTFEGWMEDGIWDIPVYGTGFSCSKAAGCQCTVDVEREDGSVCASGNVDAIGNRIFVPNGDHTLRTEDQGSCTRCEGLPVVFGCFNGKCVGGATLTGCNSGGHRVAAVKVRCEDNPEASGSVAGACPEQSNPPSNLFEVTPALNVPTQELAAEAPGAAEAGGAAGPQPITLTPMVLASPASGGDRVLCSALGDISGAGGQPVQLALRDAINASASCQAAGVTASVVEEQAFSGEDMPEEPDLRLALSAPGIRGTQMVLGTAASPGIAADQCFDLGRLGVYLANQIAIVQMRFPTGSGGAGGGEVVIQEDSPVGSCAMHVPTTPGQTGGQIAHAAAQAFQTPGTPSPATCPESNNPRDIVQDGDSIVVLLATHLRVCIRDANVGFWFGFHGLLPEPPQIQVPGGPRFADTCVGSPGVATLNVCNTGKGDLLVGPILSSAPEVAVRAPTAGYPVVISHDFCFPFQVEFTPAAAGAMTAALSIPSNDLVHPVTRVEAAGLATERNVVVTGSTDFGVASAWSPAEKTVTVCNTGGCNLGLTAATIDCPDFTLADNPVPVSVGAGSCLDLTVAFTPVLPGKKTCHLTLATDDPDTPVVTRQLTGRTPPSIGLFAGLVEPHGALAHVARQGSSLQLDFLYAWAPRWAWEVHLGAARFDGRGTLPDTDLATAGANVRYTFNPASPVRLFLHAGPGAYHFDPGDYEAGGGIGLGLQIPLDRRFSLEAVYDYHMAFTASPNLEYARLLAALRVSL